jgi:hypothetical protein
MLYELTNFKYTSRFMEQMLPKSVGRYARMFWEGKGVYGSLFPLPSMPLFGCYTSFSFLVALSFLLAQHVDHQCRDNWNIHIVISDWYGFGNGARQCSQ